MRSSDSHQRLERAVVKPRDLDTDLGLLWDEDPDGSNLTRTGTRAPGQGAGRRGIGAPQAPERVSARPTVERDPLNSPTQPPPTRRGPNLAAGGLADSERRAPSVWQHEEPRARLRSFPECVDDWDELVIDEPSQRDSAPDTRRPEDEPRDPWQDANDPSVQLREVAPFSVLHKDAPTRPPPPLSHRNVVQEAAGATGLELASDPLASRVEPERPGGVERSALGLVTQRARASRRPPSLASTPIRPLVAPSTGVDPLEGSEGGGPRLGRAPSRLTDMRDRFAVGDYSGALAAAEGVLEGAPAHPAAQHVASECRATLSHMYTARLGSLTQRPVLAVPPDQVRWLSLDHRAGFLLSLMDGQLSLEEILDVSAMSPIDALRILASLVEQGVIALRA